MPIQGPSFFASDLRDAELLNVRDFGAVGDGSTDDGAAINRAITMASGRGGVVWFPGGTFNTSQTIDIPDGVSILGVGSKKSILHYTGSGVAVEATLGGSFTGDQSIAGISVTGVAAGDVGIRIGDCWGFTLRDVSIRDFTTGIGIQLYNDSHWTEGTNGLNVRIQNCAVGLGFTRSASSTYDSFGYTRLHALGINVPANGIGIFLGDDTENAGGHYIYHSEFFVNFWLEDGAHAFAFSDASQGNFNLMFCTGENESGATGTTTWGPTNPGYWEFRGMVRVDSDDSSPHPAITPNFLDMRNGEEVAINIRGASGQSAPLINVRNNNGDQTAALYDWGGWVANYIGVGSANDDDAAFIYAGNGSPEGVVNGDPGSLYMRRDGGAGTSLYVKESGTGNTGWTAK